MPVAAQCPNCGKNLSETSVVAGAPHCTACGAWIVGVNGSLGLTSAYGVGDPALTRRRVEADLAVLHEYQTRYTGMMEHCKQKLNWSVEQYAVLPQPPQILELRSFGYNKWLERTGVAISSMGLAFLVAVPLSYVAYHFHRISVENGTFAATPYDFAEGRKHPGLWGTWVPWDKPLLQLLFVVLCVWLLVIMIGGLTDFFDVKAANGNRPQENAHRQQKYERDMTAAMKDAERKKAAEDHRLRVQIRELEGEIKAVGDKAADVRRILTTL